MKKITLCLSLLLFLIICTVSAQTGLEKGMVGYYNMEECDGEVLTNLATEKEKMPDGIIINPVWSDTAVSGYGSLYFDLPEKLPDEVETYVDFGTYDPSQGKGTFSFSCWIFWNGADGEYHGITGKRSDWTNELVYWDVCLKRTGPIQLEAVGKDEEKQLVLTDEMPLTRKWQNITVTYDGKKGSIYLDSKLLKQGEMELGLNKEAAFMLGCCEPLGVTPFQGHIDEVRYYNRALSPTEVTKLYEYPASLSSVNTQSKNKIEVYPNPAKDILNIKGKGFTEIHIFDSTGKLVKICSAGASFSSINISDLKPGLYLVSANGSSNLSKSFIKK